MKDNKGQSFPPQLSVILPAHCRSENFRLALARIRSQTISSRLELIIVVPSEEELHLEPEELAGLFSYKVLGIGPFQEGGKAKAAGVKAATASLVAFMEDHSYPHPGWAEALVRAHLKGNFAVVGPVMLNANPSSAVSWGCFLVFYGYWMAARPQEELRHLPGNQSCYRRDILLEYGSRLPDMLQTESVLHWDLLAKGFSLYQESEARMYHLNFSRISPVLREYFLTSRVFASNRVSSWGTFKKAVYTLGSTLLPPVRFVRVLKYAKRAKLRMRVLIRASSAVLLILFAGTLGEMFGYASGSGKARERLMKLERKRDTNLTSRDLEQVRVL